MSILRRYNGTEWEILAAPTIVSASTVINDSEVTGEYVDDALNTLNTGLSLRYTKTETDTAIAQAIGDALAASY